MWLKRRHQRVINIIRPIFTNHFKHKYNLKITNHKELKGRQFLVLANHCTTLDAFMVGLNFPFPLYYMTSADLFVNRFTGGLIKHLVNPIPKNKSKKDIRPVLDCKQVIKEGGSVCIFPEGNRTFSGELCYIDKSIVKLVKLLKVDLCIVNIVGGYATDPRWSYNGDLHKGKMTSDIKSITPYSELEKMSEDEIYNFIVKELDCYDQLLDVPYKSKTLAEGLERVFYKCPICGKYETIEAKKNKVYCKNCGLEVEHTATQELVSSNIDFKFKRVSDWYSWQLNELDHHAIDDDETMFSDEKVSLYECFIWKGKKRLIKDAYLGISLKEIALRSKKECIDFSIDEIDSMTALGKCKINFYVGDRIFQLKGKDSLSSLKYVHYFYKAKHLGGKDNGFWGL